jgi:hypothetical protein
MSLSGFNRRQLDEFFRRIGGIIRRVRRTGEIEYSHPSVPFRQRANGRRKDAPRSLTSYVQRVLRAIGPRIGGLQP